MGAYAKKLEKTHNDSIGAITGTKDRPMIKVVGHPFANRDGKIRYSRWVMESMVGRILSRNELVHHINGDSKDNRKENLALCNKAWHQAYHRRGRDGKEANVLWYGAFQ